jgi:hypothetical protein
MAPNFSKFAPPGDTQNYYASAPSINLQRPPRVEWESGTYLSLKLAAIPGNNDSPTYSMSVRYFDNGTPEEWLMFQKALSKVLIGQNITTGPPTYGMARRLMEGAALGKFEESALVRGAETLQHYEDVMRDITLYVFPTRALQIQKRYMRRHMRKSPYTRMKEYMARVEEINNYLTMFPGYTNGDELQEDELLDIYEFGVPHSWSRQFLLQNWDPQQHTKQEFREFCERLETAEDITSGTFVKSKRHNGPRGKLRSTMSSPRYNDTRATTSRSTGINPRFQATRNNATKTKICRLHGANNSHDTEHCKVIGEQADKMRAQWQARPNENKYKRKFDSPRRTNGRPQQSNMVERKITPFKKKTKRPTILMFEKQDGESVDLKNANSLEMENFNYEQEAGLFTDGDGNNLIDEKEFYDDLDELDPDFVKDLCESSIGEQDQE